MRTATDAQMDSSSAQATEKVHSLHSPQAHLTSPLLCIFPLPVPLICASQQKLSQALVIPASHCTSTTTIPYKPFHRLIYNKSAQPLPFPGIQSLQLKWIDTLKTLRLFRAAILFMYSGRICRVYVEKSASEKSCTTASVKHCAFCELF